MIDNDLPPACPKSDIVSSISFGELGECCKTEQDILDLIAHIRGCDTCRHVLAFINEEEPTFPEFFDPRLNVALEPITPVHLPLSSQSETILS